MSDFKETKNLCPACGGKDLNINAFVSEQGFMSIGGFNHSACLTCGTVFVNPQPTDESLDAFYQRLDDKDDSLLKSSLDRYFDQDKAAYFYKYRIEPLSRYLAPASSILDIGCGAGVFVRFMKDQGHFPEGVDISKRAVEAGKKTLGLEQELSCGTWQCKHKRYDAVTAWTVIEHLPEPYQFLLEVRDIVSSILLLEFPTTDSLMYQYLGKHFFWIMPPYHLTLFSKTGMETLLSRAGFKVMETYSMPHNWNWTSAIAKKSGVSVHEEKLCYEIDKVFDAIAYDLQASSSVVFICKKV